MTEAVRLGGRAVLISGATGGIGLATAERCLVEGAHVVLAGRSIDKVDDVLGRFTDTATAVHLDVDDPDSVASLPDRLPAPFKDVDTLVCNAGHDRGGRRPFHEGDAEQWTGIIETNVSGVIRLCSVFIDDLLARNGHIVTVGSTAGLRTYPGGSVYSTSKHAVRAFTDGLRRDYTNRPIRITEILPGLTRTGFAAARLDDDAGGKAFYDSFKDTLSADDIADAILYALTVPKHVNISQLVVTPTLEK